VFLSDGIASRRRPFVVERRPERARPSVIAPRASVSLGAEIVAVNNDPHRSAGRYTTAARPVRPIGSLRLSAWELTSDTALKWNEDGMDINADIVSLTDAELVLSLKLGNDAVEEKYVTATVPYVCPDMPKN